MTTPSAEELYLAQHRYDHEGKRNAMYNPLHKPVEELPTIFGFNNGGGKYFYHAQLIAEDGTPLGSHACSHEGYMEHDLGILEGTRPDRHETFREHYPNGYKMEFVSCKDVKTHKPLQDAIAIAVANKKEKE